MKTKKLLWLLLIVATIAAAFAFTVSATDSASEPTLKIEGGNLSFEDSVFILYAVSHEGIAAEDVRLYFWNEPQSGENAYAYDTADYSFAPYQQNVIVAEKSCVTFRNNTLRAKNMTDYVYARAYAEVDGVGYYSEVSKYSILQYAYNQLGKTAAGTSKQTLKDMLSAMLEYGAMSQIHFTYKTDRLANADYYQIKVDGGLLPDGFNKGLYLPGEKVTITAPERNGDLVFSKWVNSADETVSEDLEYEITVSEANETYTAVYVEEVRYSEGLQYFANSDGTCTVYGIGTCTDTEIRIPPTSPEGKKVTKIYSRAFANNTAITYVSIPSTVQVIGDNAFDYCPELLVVSIEEGSELSEIGSSAFYYCSKLIAVSLPEGVTTIKSSAFNRCTSLSIFSIPSTVTSIGSSAFYNCEKLVSLTIPESITSISDSAFYNCKALKTVTYSPSLVSIGKSAFFGCESLMQFDIPSTVTYIGDHAFSKCKSIPSIVLPEGLVTLGYYAFLSCTSLTEIVIPEGITHLDDGVFSGCTGLVSVTIPQSLATVDPDAFDDCDGLQNVYISDLAAWCKIEFYDYFTHPLYYAENLYLNGELITDLVIPEGVESIGLHAFYKQTSIVSVTFPTSLTFVGNSAFAGCKNLQEIHISDLAAWCKIAFDGSWNHPLEYAGALYLNGELITDLVIPEGITVIPANAFVSCSHITSVVIPASITEIGYNAFKNCTGLSYVFYGGTESEWNQLAIGANCEPLTRASRYYYSADPPTEAGNYWHYVDGEIVVWPKYTREGNYIYFGEYPQSIKASDVTITNTQDARGYYLGSDGFYYAGITAFPYPIDATYTFSTGESVAYGTIYYFKVEPLRWRILTEQNGNALILCDSVIDEQAYDGGRDNNYAESLIREWLNETFYRTAFSDFQNQIIQLTLVDNSAETTGFSPNDKACENTEDKVFLLSYADVTNGNYGFDSDGSTYDAARQIKASDYAIADGTALATDGSAPWWLRSPHNRGADLARFVTTNGNASNYYIYYSSYGVVPALWISL